MDDNTERNDLAEVRWAPRVNPHKIRRLYETDARGIVDDELIEDPVRSVGVNLIYGKNTRQVTEFLNTLSYGEASTPELKETRAAWEKKLELSQRYHPIGKRENGA